MKSSHYLAIAVRLFSIVLFIYALRQSTMLIEVIIKDSINGMPVSLLFISATVFSPLAISLLLWYFPLTVSNKILKPEIDKVIEPLSAISILTVMVLAIGLYVFYHAFIDSVYWATLWHMSSQGPNADASLYLMEDNKANIVATIVEIIVSIGLIFKAKSLSYRLLRLAE